MHYRGGFIVLGDVGVMITRCGVARLTESDTDPFRKCPF